MKKLHLSSYGLRAHTGHTLTPRAIIDFASAFATYVNGGKVVLGRDTRYSSPMVHSAVVSGLLNAGCEVIELGICPTPMIQFAVRHLKADGGLSITGQHREAGSNSIILINSEGTNVDPLTGQSILDIFHSKQFLKNSWKGMGTVNTSSDFVEAYFEKLKKLINTEAMLEANFTVFIDAVGGAGVPYLQKFAETIGVNLIPVNGEPSGYLAREAEPRPRSANQMASFIPYVYGNAGFLLCSAMNRLSLATENSEPKSEEITFALIANHILSKHKGSMVTNCCTSRVIDDIADFHGVALHKTKVGQPYVINTLADEDGIIRGEGNGSVVFPSGWRLLHHSEQRA